MSVEELLAGYNPAVQEVCFHLRKMVQLVFPDCEEIVFAGWKNISYGTGDSRADKDLICYIAPFTNSVNLGFYRGALLPDSHLLKGTGKMLRHIKITGHQTISERELINLLTQARLERLG